MLNLKLITDAFKKHQLKNLILIQFILIIFFSFIYYIILNSIIKNNSINTKLDSYFDCLYLSFMTQSTLGYDNLVSEHKSLKVCQIFQVIILFIFLAI